MGGAMIRWLIALAFIFVPIAAAAQTAAPSEVVPGKPDHEIVTQSPSGFVPPQAAGSHICSGYPKRALELKKSGKTTVHYTISAQGTVTDASIVESSGDADLDSAALLCIKAWLYHPATQNGEPVAVSWTTVYSWHIDEGPVNAGAPVPDGEVSVPQWDHGGFACEDWYTGTSRPAHAVVMTFFVEPDGSVKDVTVSQSSGNPDIDQDAVKCLSQRHYIPAKEDGKPIEVHISDWLY